MELTIEKATEIAVRNAENQFSEYTIRRHDTIKGWFYVGRPGEKEYLVDTNENPLTVCTCKFGEIYQVCKHSYIVHLAQEWELAGNCEGDFIH
jgi:hypothetical protein